MNVIHLLDGQVVELHHGGSRELALKAGDGGDILDDHAGGGKHGNAAVLDLSLTGPVKVEPVGETEGIEADVTNHGAIEVLRAVSSGDGVNAKALNNAVLPQLHGGALGHGSTCSTQMRLITDCLQHCEPTVRCFNHFNNLNTLLKFWDVGNITFTDFATCVATHGKLGTFLVTSDKLFTVSSHVSGHDKCLIVRRNLQWLAAMLPVLRPLQSAETARRPAASNQQRNRDLPFSDSVKAVAKLRPTTHPANLDCVAQPRGCVASRLRPTYQANLDNVA